MLDRLKAAASLLLIDRLIQSACAAQAATVREQQHETADRLRELARQRPSDYQTHLELATQLHSLDQQYPDGGRRIPEAEQAYR